jgi:hypothetical protein
MLPTFTGRDSRRWLVLEECLRLSQQREGNSKKSPLRGSLLIDLQVFQRDGPRIPTSLAAGGRILELEDDLMIGIQSNQPCLGGIVGHSVVDEQRFVGGLIRARWRGGSGRASGARQRPEVRREARRRVAEERGHFRRA